MNDVIINTLKEEKQYLTKKIDEMYRYNNSDEYARLTDKEIDLFQDHFDQLVVTLESVTTRMEYYEE